MKRAMLLALVLACSKKKPALLPVINSFTVDNANPEKGDTVTFSWSVTGADSLLLWPEPGAVTGTTLTFAPTTDGQFVLEATNAAGTVQQPVKLTFLPSPDVAVTHFTALPGQVAPGGEVTLSWTLTSAVTATLSDGASSPVDILGTTSLKVHPATTTTYTITATAKPGHKPASATARAVARVAQAAAISSFTATPQSLVQGQASTLAWEGTASSWSVTYGATTVQLGPQKSLVVRPASDTTYTLQATGPGGSDSKTAAITVTPHVASALAYTEPTDSGPPLKLTAVSPCSTTCTLAIVAQAAGALRGVAMNLPLDSTKVTVGAFSTSLSTAAVDAALGSGPLQDTLVFGAALEGSGTAPAADVSFNAGDEVARFTLTLVPAGGAGNVFDGSNALRSWVQRAAGRATGAIAVGKLDAN